MTKKVTLVEIEPGLFVVKRLVHKAAKSDLPLPYVISDQMEPTEQVDGRFYTSKRKFRAVGRALGLTEVGNEKFKPKGRATDDHAAKAKRRQQIRTAIDKYKAGHRVR